MSKFRTKPAEIEAVQWTGDNWRELYDFTRGGDGNRSRVYGPHPDDSIHVDAPDGGLMTARKGDWIIRGVKGELYLCKPNIFGATYEPSHDAS